MEPNMIRIMGIDPGVSGALALVSGARVIEVWDVPTMAKTTGKGLQINSAALGDLMVVGDPNIVVIERVGAMPKQGVTSMFNFGYSAGILDGVTGALAFTVRFVHPNAWKKHFGLTGKDKDAARTLAIQRHPEAAARLTLKKHVGRADAILLADYLNEVM